MYHRNNSKNSSEPNFLGFHFKMDHGVSNMIMKKYLIYTS